MPKGGGKKDSGAPKKADKKLAAKIIEDKTFGLKNKNKSKAVQKYIKGIEQNTKQRIGIDIDKQKEYQEKAEKKKQKAEEAFLASLYKSVNAVKEQEVPEGVDSKTILCELFKEGKCTLGDKCKFSHDLNIDFNQGTFDIYTDLREIKNKMEKEVNKIAEEKEKKRKNQPETTIVCKYFLDAVKKKIYGWNWECPNGETCHYRHFLPPGYILFTDKDKSVQEDMTIEEYMDLEEKIDAERERLAENGTKVNEATFKEWKLKRDEFRNATKEEGLTDVMVSKLTGVQLFQKQRELFKDDENAEDVKMDEIENNMLDEEENKEKKEEENKAKTDEEILKELDEGMKEIKINEDLFKEGENLDELDQIIDDEDPKEEPKEDPKEEPMEEDNKEDDE
ncbi:MAG: hypothetical protein MJ252_05170 [archaeon]|nr:hypothetical protein [archaeon]